MGCDLGHDLDLELSRSNMGQKWSDWHGTKSKHIDWTPGLICDHQVWPWPWPWPWIFKVEYGICYISAKSGPIATEWKGNISIELQASNVTNGFDLDHNLDLWNLKVKRDLHLWPHTWPSPWIFMVKCGNRCIAEWEGWLALHKGCGSRSFMTMTVTIWWLRSGVWIYQIVTGVTSVVGVPSTHLVSNMVIPIPGKDGLYIPMLKIRWLCDHLIFNMGMNRHTWKRQSLYWDEAQVVRWICCNVRQ